MTMNSDAYRQAILEAERLAQQRQQQQPQQPQNQQTSTFDPYAPGGFIPPPPEPTTPTQPTIPTTPTPSISDVENPENIERMQQEYEQTQKQGVVQETPTKGGMTPEQQKDYDKAVAGITEAKTLVQPTPDTKPVYSPDGQKVTINGVEYGVDKPLPGAYQYYSPASGGLVAGVYVPVELGEGMNQVSNATNELVAEIVKRTGASYEEVVALLKTYVNEPEKTIIEWDENSLGKPSDDVIKARTLINRYPELIRLLGDKVPGDVWKDFKNGIPFVATQEKTDNQGNYTGEYEQAVVLLGFDEAQKLGALSPSAQFYALRDKGIYPVSWEYIQITDKNGNEAGAIFKQTQAQEYATTQLKRVGAIDPSTGSLNLQKAVDAGITDEKIFTDAGFQLSVPDLKDVMNYVTMTGRLPESPDITQARQQIELPDGSIMSRELYNSIKTSDPDGFKILVGTNGSVNYLSYKKETAKRYLDSVISYISDGQSAISPDNYSNDIIKQLLEAGVPIGTLSDSGISTEKINTVINSIEDDYNKRIQENKILLNDLLSSGALTRTTPSDIMTHDKHWLMEGDKLVSYTRDIYGNFKKDEITQPLPDEYYNYDVLSYLASDRKNGLSNLSKLGFTGNTISVINRLAPYATANENGVYQFNNQGLMDYLLDNRNSNQSQNDLLSIGIPATSLHDDKGNITEIGVDSLSSRADVILDSYDYNNGKINIFFEFVDKYYKDNPKEKEKGFIRHNPFNLAFQDYIKTLYGSKQGALEEGKSESEVAWWLALKNSFDEAGIKIPSDDEIRQAGYMPEPDVDMFNVKYLLAWKNSSEKDKRKISEILADDQLKRSLLGESLIPVMRRGEEIMSEIPSPSQYVDKIKEIEKSDSPQIEGYKYTLSSLGKLAKSIGYEYATMGATAPGMLLAKTQSGIPTTWEEKVFGIAIPITMYTPLLPMAIESRLALPMVVGMTGVGTYAYVKNWKDMTPQQRTVYGTFLALPAVFGAKGIKDSVIYAGRKPISLATNTYDMSSITLEKGMPSAELRPGVAKDVGIDIVKTSQASLRTPKVTELNKGMEFKDNPKAGDSNYKISDIKNNNVTVETIKDGISVKKFTMPVEDFMAQIETGKYLFPESKSIATSVDILWQDSDGNYTARLTPIERATNIMAGDKQYTFSAVGDARFLNEYKDIPSKIEQPIEHIVEVPRSGGSKEWMSTFEYSSANAWPARFNDVAPRLKIGYVSSGQRYYKGIEVPEYEAVISKNPLRIKDGYTIQYDGKDYKYFRKGEEVSLREAISENKTKVEFIGYIGNINEYPNTRLIDIPKLREYMESAGIYQDKYNKLTVKELTDILQKESLGEASQKVLFWLNENGYLNGMYPAFRTINNKYIEPEYPIAQGTKEYIVGKAGVWSDKNYYIKDSIIADKFNDTYYRIDNKTKTKTLVNKEEAVKSGNVFEKETLKEGYEKKNNGLPDNWEKMSNDEQLKWYYDRGASVKIIGMGDRIPITWVSVNDPYAKPPSFLTRVSTETLTEPYNRMKRFLKLAGKDTIVTDEKGETTRLPSLRRIELESSQKGQVHIQSDKEYFAVRQTGGVDNGTGLVVLGDRHGVYRGMLKDINFGFKNPIVIGLSNKPITWKWAGKSENIIQVGDIIDRGAYYKQIRNALNRLHDEAIKTGGIVERLLGNHELAYLTGDKIHGIKYSPKEALSIRKGIIEDILSGRVKASTEVNGQLFTHAGLNLDKFPEYRGMDAKAISNELNNKLVEAVKKDIAGDKNAYKDKIFDMQTSEVPTGGANVNSSDKGGIFWARPDEGNFNLGYKQFYGHTPQITFNNNSWAITERTPNNIGVETAVWWDKPLKDPYMRTYYDTPTMKTIPTGRLLASPFEGNTIRFYLDEGRVYPELKNKIIDDIFSERVGDKTAKGLSEALNMLDSQEFSIDVKVPSGIKESDIKVFKDKFNDYLANSDISLDYKYVDGYPSRYNPMSLELGLANDKSLSKILDIQKTVDKIASELGYKSGDFKIKPTITIAKLKNEIIYADAYKNAQEVLSRAINDYYLRKVRESRTVKLSDLKAKDDKVSVPDEKFKKVIDKEKDELNNSAKDELFEGDYPPATPRDYVGQLKYKPEQIQSLRYDIPEYEDDNYEIPVAYDEKGASYDNYDLLSDEAIEDIKEYTVSEQPETIKETILEPVVEPYPEIKEPEPREPEPPEPESGTEQPPPPEREPEQPPPPEREPEQPPPPERIIDDDYHYDEKKIIEKTTKIKPPPPIGDNESQAMIIANPPPGTIVWKQGTPLKKGGGYSPMYRVWVAPYGEQDAFSTRTAPMGYNETGITGKGSARKTVQVLGGAIPRVTSTNDMGTQLVSVVDGELRFNQDPADAYKGKLETDDIEPVESLEDIEQFVQPPILTRKPKNMKAFYEMPEYNKQPIRPSKATLRKIKKMLRDKNGNYYLGHKILNPDIGTGE